MCNSTNDNDNDSNANNDCKTSLMKACADGHTETVKRLLENGHNPGLQDNEGWTALMWACHYSNSEVVKILLETGKACPELKNKKGSDAFKITLNQGFYKVSDNHKIVEMLSHCV